jgi:hypothetical protein
MFENKPPYSKDGKLQLCFRCGYYCRRTVNTCPNCTGHADGEFKLANDPAPHKPAQFDNDDPRRQRTLIDGLQCLPGQLDLF